MLNELNLTPELLEKAKSATSATALLAFAQENDITLTTEEAANYYRQLHPKEGALSDDELDNVSGGGICDDPKRKLANDYVRTNYCGKDPRCSVFETQDAGKKQTFMDMVETWGQVCPACSCKEDINAHCRSMGWKELNNASVLRLL